MCLLKKRRLLGIFASLFLICYGVYPLFTQIENNYNRESSLNYAINFDSSFKILEKDDALDRIYYDLELDTFGYKKDELRNDLSLLIEKDNYDLLISKYLFDRYNEKTPNDIMSILKSYDGLSREELTTKIFNGYDDNELFNYNITLINVQNTFK